MKDPNGTYQSWLYMKDRCDNTEHIYFAYYGGRGVTYDPSWKDYNKFLKQMGERPFGTTLGRRMDLGNYSVHNCSWQTPEQQSAEADKKIEAYRYKYKGRAVSATRIKPHAKS